MEVLSVRHHRVNIEDQLRHLARTRANPGIEPPVSEAECVPLLEKFRIAREENGLVEDKQAQYAAVETVFRENFYSILATTEIDQSSFAQIWTLLDLATVLADNELCEPPLALWLIEELLESQTIEGCRLVFDYLESRREGITARHFKNKSLALLRFCNELLRRLSRAEDTVFCGRVFIFLFQSFSLGDKSSVNLRGEFHVENVTAFDLVPQKSEDAIKPMEIDSEAGRPIPSRPGTPASSSIDLDAAQKTGRNTPAAPKSTMVDEAPDLDTLYPLFWSLQAFFSSPTRLFDGANMTSFKSGISATISVFQKMHNMSSSSSSSVGLLKRGTKRKSPETASSASNTFNPKYLTNRDLFDLEVHDLAFRRHILVQALILIDFLLSLTPTSKTKLADLTNKSVLYSYTLNEEDARWATTTRSTIATYLQTQGTGTEGKFYHRMVDTVLSRDKNWVRWKAENCPVISRPPVDVQTYVQAQDNLSRICKKQHYNKPQGADDMAFFRKKESMEVWKESSRRTRVPSVEEYYKGIQGDELDMEMGTAEEINAAKTAKDAKVWRALRASGRRFVLSDKIANGKDLGALIGQEKEQRKRSDDWLNLDGVGEKENQMSMDGAGDDPEDGLKEEDEVGERSPSDKGEASVQTGVGEELADVKEQITDAPKLEEMETTAPDKM